MKKQKLEVNTLEISSFEPQPQAASVPVQMMTGGSGYCNTCDPTGCVWTV